MRVSSLVFIFILLFASSAMAQVLSNDFSIRIDGLSDIEAPTTPTLLSATPIAATQIDLSWSVATDNVLISGYSVLRDGVPIATTSLLAYSDTSLTASTTYAYAIRAFDPSFNYSSTSNSLTVTTPNPSLPASTTPSGSQTQGTAARVAMDNLVIDAGVSTTSFTIVTAHQARLELRWGRTASYELGYVMSDVFAKEHIMQLAELEPRTTYEYEIIGYTPLGAQTVLKRGTFTTLGMIEPMLPVNVGRFTAVGRGADVALHWENPPEAAMAQVRIVRSHLGFPEHPQDGAIVYQGLETDALDLAILSQYSPVYYTAFVYDHYGNVSSGAVAIVYAPAPGPRGTKSETPPAITIDDTVTDATVATSSVVTNRVTIDMKIPALADLRLTQTDSSFTFVDTDIVIDTKQEFTIRIPRSAVAGNLKSIIATIVDPQEKNQTYSYLLRINKDRTAYEAQIPPLLVSGKGVIVVGIYDYEAFIVATYQAPVNFVERTVETESPVLFPDILFTKWPLILFGIGAVLVLILIIVLIKRSRAEDND